jgi:hypothetical protein
VCDAKEIPDEDLISREVDFPLRYTDKGELVWEQIFVFASNEPIECVMWRRYAPKDEDVHFHGCDRERAVRARKPEFRYTGFVSTAAAVVRSIKTRAGHSFEVIHTPKEGAAHAEIRFKPALDKAFTRAEKNELRLSIRKVFGDHVPHSCEE